VLSESVSYWIFHNCIDCQNDLQNQPKSDFAESVTLFFLNVTNHKNKKYEIKRANSADSIRVESADFFSRARFGMKPINFWSI
jgi:hypothetical protein